MTNRKNLGFTLIELMIVISLIGILSGVVYSVINAPRKRAEAQDAVKLSNLQSLVTGLEAYNAGEGRYPVEGSLPTYSPLTGTDASITGVYLKQWPTGFVYHRSSETVFIVYVPKSTTTTHCYKYFSSKGSITSCTSNCARNILDIGCTSL